MSLVNIGYKAPIKIIMSSKYGDLMDEFAQYVTLLFVFQYLFEQFCVFVRKEILRAKTHN